MKVLVLGCGPAGLLAAYAAQREFNAEVRILSVKRYSQLFGCQYLHSDIPGLDLVSETVRYQLTGDADDYRKKVYGTLRPPVSVSPQLYAGDAPAWDIREAYAKLWEMFEPSIFFQHVEPHSVIPMLSAENPDAVISSIPLDKICQQGEKHSFTSMPVWATGDSDEHKIGEWLYVEPFTVVCDGTDSTGWYRAANVFDYRTVEWPGERRRVPIDGVVKVNKPLVTDCDCLNGVLRVGRYGRWQKGVLVHETYAATVNYLKAMRRG